VGVAPAGAVDVVLYELSENITLTSTNRSATTTYSGRATVGTPICPQSLVNRVNPGAKSCSVIISGMENISRNKGTGDLNGAFNVVVELDNTVDGPEKVVFEGQLSGTANLSPALLDGIPYGTLNGTLTDADDVRHPFSGVFRLPFLGSYRPFGAQGPTNRQIYCPKTTKSASGTDLAWLDTTDGLPNGSCLNIVAHELALGTPVMRLDLMFTRDSWSRDRWSDDQWSRR
jgi:hypothetical protein